MIGYVRAVGAVAVATLLLCNDTPALSLTAATMTIVSGNGQTVDQNRVLAQPFQVRLTTASDQPDPNVGVVFTATRNNGLNAPEIVATSNAGLATWLPGAFRNPGTYTITASAAGYNSVSFTVTVNDTPNDYDGTYYCTTYQTDNSRPPPTPEIMSMGSHEFTILNNKFIQPDPLAFHELRSTSDPNAPSTYNPATDILRAFIGNGVYGNDFIGKIVLDDEGTARIDGNFSVSGLDGGLQPRPRTWRCIRE